MVTTFAGGVWPSFLGELRE